jgi:4-amino-4-deoxy-L-arabinose transferase-like glycosyltransferase
VANDPARSAALRASAAATTLGAELSRWLAGLFWSTAALQAMEREQVVHRAIFFFILGTGAIVRFWGLGSVGLHGDEETMAMAVRHILQDGQPILPSGMLYPRGLTQLYLMALSVWGFGESEWTLRLPSALCGLLLVGLAWLAGRRFLRPQWNLAFAASTALLPDMIIASQTARMYIFMLTCVAASMVCIFAWERSGRLRPLLAAVALLILGIDFQALTVTAVLLLLLPGLLQRDLRKLSCGVAGIAAVMLSHLVIDTWVASQYPVPPPEFGADTGPPQWGRTPGEPFALAFQVALWGAGVVVAFLALLVGRTVKQRSWSSVATLLLLAAVLWQLLLMYHIAGLLVLAAFIITRRNGSPLTMPRLGAFALGSAAILLVQGTLLAARPGSIIKLVGAMVGEPSVWPYVRVANVSVVAALLAAGSLAWGIHEISRRRPAPDYSLLAVLGVWPVLLAVGSFVWNVPPRYTAAAWLPMLLCAFAFAQAGVQWLQNSWLGGARVLPGIAAALTAVLVIDPARAASVIAGGYSSIHPDHKGAAYFMQAQGIVPEDVVIAEDVLQQTYYLGSVDYWLVGRKHGRRFVERVNGRIVDFYTHTPVITSAAELNALLQRERGRRIFIIGSGENQKDRRRDMRGDMHEVLESERFAAIFTGRDGLTRILQPVDRSGQHGPAPRGAAPATAE